MIKSKIIGYKTLLLLFVLFFDEDFQRIINYFGMEEIGIV